MSQTNGKAKAAKKNKPLRRAEKWSREVPGMALRILGFMVAVIIMGLMFSALQAVESIWLRSALSVLILSGVLLLCCNEGLTKGMSDAGASRFYADAKTKGIPLAERDDAACYHPLKPVCAGLLVFAVPLAMAVYVALTTKGYTYSLQDLPAWLTDSYGMREDVMAPLGAYAMQQGMTAYDWLRLIVRLPVMIYINLFADPLTMGAAIDRATPLFLLTYPLAYTLGYAAAPHMRRKTEKMNRRAKKIAVRKAQKSTLAQTLVGDQHGVHYGHRANDDKHKKKELV